MNKLGFNIILLGAIASGKDTQGEILKKTYKLKSFESGKHFRKMIKNDTTPDGDWVRRTVGKGKPAPVALVKKILEKVVAEKPTDKNLLFVGNPKLKPEAQFLKKTFEGNNEDFMVLYLDIPLKEIYARSKIREKELGRTDDSKYTQKRIKWHKEQMGKTLDYFKGLGKLKKINGNQTVSQVTKDIITEIEKYKNSLKS